jgi:hypothetical protein
VKEASPNGSLPYGEDAEKGVLSSLIISPREVAALCASRLPSVAFYAPAHKILYELLIEFAEQGKPTQFPLVKQALKDAGVLEEIGGPEFLDELYDFVPTAAGADYYIKIARENFGLRRLNLLGRKLSSQCQDGQAEIAGLLAEAQEELTEIAHSSKSESPEWLKFEDVNDLPDEEAERVIENLLRVGEKLGITSGSKSFKSWMLLYAAFCIANGLDFLGWKTNKSKVILFDLELSRNSLKRRLRRIQKTLGAGAFDNIKVCSLRGKAQLFCKNFEKIKAQIVADNLKVVIIDPVYKFLS